MAPSLSDSNHSSLERMSGRSARNAGRVEAATICARLLITESLRAKETAGLHDVQSAMLAWWKSLKSIRSSVPRRSTS